MKITREEISQYMHEHIPVTKTMSISIEELTETSICLSAPIGPNINHRASVFGGSISTLGITSGWALLYSALKRSSVPNTLVIQESHTKFLLPIKGEFRAICDELTKEKYEELLEKYHRKGKARVKLASQILFGRELAAIHHGSYVIIKR